MTACRSLIQAVCSEKWSPHSELLGSLLIQSLQGFFLGTDIVKQELKIDLREPVETQMTSVRTESLTVQAAQLLDFQQFGLFFNYDMLGYAFMSFANFFAGLTVSTNTKSDKWLQTLLLVHGLFFITCFFISLLEYLNLI